MNLYLSKNTMNDLEALLLDQLSTAVFYLDDQLQVQYMNSAAEVLLGMSANRICGTRINILLPEAVLFCRKLEDALRLEHPYMERELRLPVTDENEIILDYVVTPVRKENHCVGLLIELHQLDRQLRMTREENLLAQQQASRAVIRGLAHEIKNPLGGLRGAAQLLEHELADPDLLEYTQIIMNEADRLQNLVDAMLGPNRPPRKEDINIHQIVEHVRALVEAEGHPGIVIQPDYDPSLPTLIADPDQLIQALLNVARNAVQALTEQARQGEPAIIQLRTRSQRQLTIGMRLHKLVIRLDVIDNGPGIPPELIEHVFYPMITSRPDGTGLGLSIAQDLIARHGGLIECQSRPGHTRFTLFLPLEPTSHEQP